ncbi:MAG: cytochrome c oxidase subunit II [Solirubrobacteraceae bacterium]
MHRKASPTEQSYRTGRRLIACAATALGASLVLAPSAFANLLTPKSGGSPNANNIHTLYVIVLAIAVVVFIGVEGTLAYAVYKFRASKGAVAQQIHGNTRLEVTWTAGAAVIVTLIALVTFIMLPSIVDAPNSGPDGYVLSASLTQPTPPNGQKLVVCVTGRQFIWRYTYGAGCNKSAWSDDLPYSYQEMVVPSDTTVQLVIQSNDVIHSWWVPSLGGKIDAVPGYTTYTWFKALHANELYHGNCAQLCGRQHAFMTALVKVVTPAQYSEWISQQSQLIKAANDQVTQLRELLIQQGDLTPSGNF